MPPKRGALRQAASHHHLRRTPVHRQAELVLSSLCPRLLHLCAGTVRSSPHKGPHKTELRGRGVGAQDLKVAPARDGPICPPTVGPSTTAARLSANMCSLPAARSMRRPWRWLRQCSRPSRRRRWRQWTPSCGRSVRRKNSRRLRGRHGLPLAEPRRRSSRRMSSCTSVCSPRSCKSRACRGQWRGTSSGCLWAAGCGRV